MSKTLRILLLAAAGSIIGTAASANGYINRNWGGSIKDEMPPIMWTGLYVGGHLGYSFGSPNGSGEIEFEEPEPEGAEFQGSIDPQLEGSVYGIHVGYNFQRGQFVFGIEGDYSKTNASGSTVAFGALEEGDDDNGGDDEDDRPFARVSHHLDYLASVRGRIGVTLDQVLVYATAGVAWTDYKLSGSVEDDRVSLSQNKTGWVAGGGVEWRITPKLSLRGEVLHYDFGSVKGSELDLDEAEIERIKMNVNTTVVRGGITFHFN